MKVTYAAVPMQICHFHDFSMRAVYSEDGADYLYTHVYIDVTCWFNPALQGVPPFASIPNLRGTLLQPRQALVVDIGGFIVLSTPQTINGVKAPMDVNNGPRPIDCKVVEFQETKTAIVRFTIETWIIECNPVPGAILSHRWAMIEELGEDYRSRRHITGKAVFRADILALEQLSADAYRAQLGHPTLAGFMRENFVYNISSDGLTLEYSFTDTQQIWALDPNSGIIHIEGYSEVAMGGGTLNFRSGWAAANDLWNGDVGSYLSNVADLWGGLIPQSSFTVLCNIRGAPWTTRAHLANVLSYVAANIFGGVLAFAWGSLPFTAFVARVMFPQREAFLMFRFHASGYIANFVASLLSVGPANLAASNLLTFEGIPGLATFTGNALPPSIAPPNSNATRGNMLLQLVAQQLKGPCGVPAAPPTPGNVFEVPVA